MSEAAIEALAEALEPLVRRIVREEVRRQVAADLARWLTVPQAAARIGIGESAVRDRIRRGLLAGRKWEGRWYVASADIDEKIALGQPSATVPSFSVNGPGAAGTARGPATRSVSS
jgi:helix-turn-helix protein